MDSRAVNAHTSLSLVHSRSVHVLPLAPPPPLLLLEPHILHERRVFPRRLPSPPPPDAPSGRKDGHHDCQDGAKWDDDRQDLWYDVTGGCGKVMCLSCDYTKGSGKVM